MWKRTALTERLGIELPIIQAPMGGGPSTPALAVAVSEAGGLGSLAGGYRTPDQIRNDILETRRRTRAPFAVNLFTQAEPPVPSHVRLDEANRSLDRYREELGLEAGRVPVRFAEDLGEQFGVVLAGKPAVFSFTFGIPAHDILESCRAAGIFTIGTATNLAEGLALQEAGVDAVCAQGVEAGGHRGTFLGSPDAGHIGLLALVSQLVEALKVPVIASGGLMNGAGIAAALALGAQGVQLGTAFLLCPEAATSAPYRRALTGPDRVQTALTAAFSGREARGIENRFMREMAEVEPLPYPYQNALTRDLRQAAVKAGRAEFLSLWAGQGVSLIREMPARELISTLVRETELALRKL